MADARAALADLTTLDRAALEALIVAQQGELSVQQEKLLRRDNEIEHLKLVIARLRRMMFGTKSEKVTREIEQLELKLEELETRESEQARTTPTSTAPVNKPTRRPLPEHLPREVHCICLTRSHAGSVAASCASWVKMSPRCWSTSRPDSR